MPEGQPGAKASGALVSLPPQIAFDLMRDAGGQSIAEVLAGRLEGTIGSAWPFFDKELRLCCKFANDAQNSLCADGQALRCAGGTRCAPLVHAGVYRCSAMNWHDFCKLCCA